MVLLTALPTRVYIENRTGMNYYQNIRELYYNKFEVLLICIGMIMILV